MLDTLLITVLSWGRAPPPPPPPPPPSMVDTILAISGDYPKLTTVFLVWLNLYLLLSVIGDGGQKPGAAAKVPASDVPVYKAGGRYLHRPEGQAIIVSLRRSPLWSRRRFARCLRRRRCSSLSSRP